MRNRGNILVLAGPTLVGLWFLYAYAFGYLAGEPGRFGIYFPRRAWLTIHIFAGVAAILLGPIQLWMGLNRRVAILHRVLGLFYVASAATGAVTALYLAKHTDFGWVFGLGLGSMAVAWIVTTGLATIAICRKMVQLHREWMIRSYVVTFSFVTLRAVSVAFELVKHSTLIERLSAASWISWTVPLFLTEVILHGRMIFARRAIAAPQPVTHAESTEPELTAFGLHNSESTYLRRP
jgi:uncharacterized membrane protein